MAQRTRSHSGTQPQTQTNCWRLLSSFSSMQARPQKSLFKKKKKVAGEERTESKAPETRPEINVITSSPLP